MQKGDYLQAILRSSKTVLTLKDAALLWKDDQTDAARVRLNYYVRKGDLYRIRRSLYTKSKEYNKLELATRIFTPAYVSFESVLAREGVIFQYQDQITTASYLTRDISVGEQIYSYRKIKTDILTNSMGIEHRDETSIATKERALLDTLYSNIDYHFDNIRSINWEKVLAMLPIYNNKRMAQKVHQLSRQSQESK